MISIQTNGTLLNEKLIDELEDSGLTRINLSLDTLNSELAKKLKGTVWYDLEKIVDIAEYIAQSKIDLLIAPVWVPTLNDNDIPSIIEFTMKLVKESHWPILGIQKYVAHKYGRKPPGVKEMKWWQFYRQLEMWEKQFNIKPLKLHKHHFGIYDTKAIPREFRIGEKVRVKLLAPGWMRGEMIGVARDRCITVVNCNREVGDIVNVRIVANKHNLYIAKPITTM